MEFSYGKGIFLEGNKKIEGTIILSLHKLFLKGEKGDIAATYLPLEKIERIVKSASVLTIHVRPSLAYRYIAQIKGDKKHINELTKDLVERRQLQKKFLKNEWVEQQN